MPDPSPLVAVIEDDADLGAVIEHNLRLAGFDVARAALGREGLALVRTVLPSIVLLDLMLPDVPGTEICRKLKSDASTLHIPVILVTAKGAEIDRVVGFELGADDYVTKPFSVRELILRVRAVLRRSTTSISAREAVSVGSIVLDVGAHRAVVSGTEVSLTPLEFRLLRTLLARGDRVQSRETLLRDVWGLDVSVESRTVDTHVKRLREKLGDAGAMIETVRGVGYRVTMPTLPSD